MSDQHPEDRCHRCGGPNVVWSAPSPLWNRVMRPADQQGHPGGEAYGGIVCPTCFAALATEAGCGINFRLTCQEFPTDGAMFTDGRVWSDAKQLWVEP